MSVENAFDITVYGATGFTGRLAAEELARDPSLKLAIAGRDRLKLESLAQGFAIKPSVLVAESRDQKAIDAMVRASRVIVNCAGPFSRHAEGLIKACAEQGKAYCDITGEAVFVADMIARYQTLALQNGAVLIPMAGFDSVPADLTSYLAFELAKAKSWAVDELEHFYKIRGGFNGGTIETALTIWENKEEKRFRDENLLIPDSSWPNTNSLKARPSYDDHLKVWSAPFFMQLANAPVVRRSRFLAGDDQFAKTEYSERIVTGKGVGGQVAATAITLGLAASAVLGSTAVGRNMIRKLSPSPGEGPSAESREKGFYSGTVLAREKDKVRAIVRMKAKGDPGNVVTVTCLNEVARLLAKGEASSKGFTTGSIAFGQKLVERLRSRGMELSTEIVHGK